MTANITLAGTLPNITSEITLEGNNFYVDGAGAFRVFDVTSTGDFTINQTTIQNGNAGIGGGILNYGILEITDSTLSGNSAALGGAIYDDNGATTNLNRTLISGNTATTSGNEIYNRSLGPYLGTVNANNFNLFGDNSEINAQAFTNFTPGASDITATSDGTMPTALASILDPMLALNSCLARAGLTNAVFRATWTL